MPQKGQFGRSKNSWKNNSITRQAITFNGALRSVRATIVAVEKQ